MPVIYRQTSCRIVVHDGDEVFGNYNNIEYRGTLKGSFNVTGDKNNIWSSGRFVASMLHLKGDSNSINLQSEALLIYGDSNTVRTGSDYLSITIKGHVNTVHSSVHILTINGDINSHFGKIYTKKSILGEGNTTPDVGNPNPKRRKPTINQASSSSTYYSSSDSSSSSSSEDEDSCSGTASIGKGWPVRAVQAIEVAINVADLHRTSIESSRPPRSGPVFRQFGANSSFTYIGGDSHTINFPDAQSPVVPASPLAPSVAVLPVPVLVEPSFQFPRPKNLQPQDDVEAGDEVDSSIRCTICMANKRQLVYRPCNHCFACISCTYKHIDTYLKDNPEKRTVPCPYCRSESTEVFAVINC